MPKNIEVRALNARYQLAARCIALGRMLVLAALLGACAEPIEEADESLVAQNSQPLTDEPPPLFVHTDPPVVEASGVFVAYHGRHCISSPRGDQSAQVVVGIALPDYAADGTVILNGTDLSYDGATTDHHVTFVSTQIRGISVNTSGNKSIKFLVMATLRDANGDDPFTVCFTYTALAWSKLFLDAVAEESESSGFVYDFYADGPLYADEAKWDDPAGTLRAGAVAAVLPRAWAAGFAPESGFDWFPPHAYFNETTSHHLLHVGYSLGQPFGASDGFLHWNVGVYLRDDTMSRTLVGGAWAGLIGGSAVTVRDAAFSVPHTSSLSPGHSGVAVQTDTLTYSGLTSDFAIPILSGCDLRFSGSDQHVQRLGVWINGFNYTKSTGILNVQVSSILRDADGTPNFDGGTGISILGLDRRWLINPRPRD